MSDHDERQRRPSRYTVIDFLEDFLKDVFFSILIGVLYKIGRVLIARSRLPLKETIVYTLLILYYRVFEGIEEQLPKFFRELRLREVFMLKERVLFVAHDNQANKAKRVLHRPRHSLFFFLLKHLDPNLKLMCEFSMQYRKTTEKHERVYYIQSAKEFYHALTKKYEVRYTSV